MLLSRSVLTFRLTLATVCSPSLPVSACCFASSVMWIAPPLMPLPVTLLPLPEAPITTGGVALQLPLVGTLLPGTLSPPVVAWPCWLVPTPPAVVLPPPPLPPPTGIMPPPP